MRSRVLPQVCYQVDFVSDCHRGNLNSYRAVTLKNNDVMLPWGDDYLDL